MGDFDYYMHDYLKYNKDFANLINNIIRKYNVYVFGGFVRDYLYEYKSNFRDIDIVVDLDAGLLDKKIFSYIPKNNISINQFDGYKLNLNNKIIDIWAIDKTWAIRKGFFSKKELLKTVYLNIDAYAYDITNRCFLDNCNEIKKPRKIDICFELNPNEELNLARSLVLSRKYNIMISDRIKGKLLELLNSNEKKKKFLLSQISHYGKVEIQLEDLFCIINNREVTHA